MARPFLLGVSVWLLALGTAAAKIPPASEEDGPASVAEEKPVALDDLSTATDTPPPEAVPKSTKKDAPPAPEPKANKPHGKVTKPHDKATKPHDKATKPHDKASSKSGELIPPPAPGPKAIEPLDKSDSTAFDFHGEEQSGNASGRFW